MSHELFCEVEDRIRQLGYEPPVRGEQENSWLLKMIAMLDDIKKRLDKKENPPAP